MKKYIYDVRVAVKCFEVSGDSDGVVGRGEGEGSRREVARKDAPTRCVV